MAARRGKADINFSKKPMRLHNFVKEVWQTLLLRAGFFPPMARAGTLFLLQLGRRNNRHTGSGRGPKAAIVLASSLP
jgi:hypothetical protein